MARLLYIVTHSMSARLLLGSQLGFMRLSGLDVTLISSPGDDLAGVAENERIQVLPIPIKREISPWHDLVALWRIYRAIRRIRPHIVNASTPKAGLLGALAAWMACVPIRIHLQRGLRSETTSGLKRLILWTTERLTSACAHEVVCISNSLLRACEERGLVVEKKTRVLLAGSSNGVDTERFCLDPQVRAQASELRRTLNVPIASLVVGFIGRLTRDKGIVELVHGFQRVLKTVPDARLLIVGDFEHGDPVPTDCQEWIQRHSQVTIVPFTADPKPFYALIDVLAFPTHREGFGNVAIEAAAMELPVVGFQVTGVVDSVEDGVSGTLVPFDDVDAFSDALVRYLRDPELRRQHGQAGRQRVLRVFRQEDVWRAWYGFYVELLHERGIPIPEPAQPAGHSLPNTAQQVTQP